MTPASPPSGAPRLLFIDSLRGVAATSVMLYHLYHAAAIGTPPAEPYVGLFFRLMESGVEMFFVLSGFVICANVEAAREVGPRFLGRFYLRRSLRLDPVYWVVIALNAVFLFTLSTTSKAESIGPIVVLSNMFYLNNIFGQLAIVPVGWTLCFEVQFYLGFAILLGVTRLLTNRLGVARGIARALVFMPLLAWSAWVAAHTVPMRAATWGLVGWHLFFLGASLRWATNEKDRASWILFGLSAAVSASVMAWTLVPNIGFALAIAASILWAWRSGALSRPIGRRALGFLGAISYSLYLLHPFIGNKALRFLAPRLASLPDGPRLAAQWGLVALGAGLCIVTAWVLHVLIERPAQRFSRRVQLEPKEPSIAAEAVAPS